MQKIFEEERSFFQALSFIKRVEISQNEKSQDQNSSESLFVKLNENSGKPVINFKVLDEQKIQDLIKSTIFQEYIRTFEIKNDQGKIESEFSAVISGLKIYLDETALEYISDINESFFNLDAKPFKPKAKDAGPT